jgi:hypothetical protein
VRGGEALAGHEQVLGAARATRLRKGMSYAWVTACRLGDGMPCTTRRYSWSWKPSHASVAEMPPTKPWYSTSVTSAPLRPAASDASSPAAPLPTTSTCVRNAGSSPLLVVLNSITVFSPSSPRALAS